MTWTAADAAELDVLLDELTRGHFDHRERGCEGCNPEPCQTLNAYLEHRADCWKCRHGIKVTTAFYGEPCPRHLAHLEHGGTCARCQPCPRLRVAIDVVLEWRRRRELLSRAEGLRVAETVRYAA